MESSLTHILVTVEIERNSCLPFFDILINRTPERSLKFRVYIKLTNINDYLKLNSNNPQVHKRSVVSRYLEERLRFVVTTQYKIKRTTFPLFFETIDI
jgi:hypothetical protein